MRIINLEVTVIQKAFLKFYFKRMNTFLHPFLLMLILTFTIQTRGVGQSTSEDSLLTVAHSYFDQSEEKKALAAYQKVLKANSTNFEALWHTSLLYARVGYRYDSEEEMMSNYQEALKYAEKTIRLYPNQGYSHFVYAIANGRISDLSDTQTRIKKSHVVKKHSEKAVELLPDYGPAWHLLGLWHSKVANIGTAQKFAAGLFSQGVPEGASNQKAVQYMQEAIRLDPDQTLRYKLDLARHYERAGENAKATQTLKEVLKITPENYIDDWNLGQARELLSSLQ